MASEDKSGHDDTLNWVAESLKFSVKQPVSETRELAELHLKRENFVFLIRPEPIYVYAFELRPKVLIFTRKALFFVCVLSS